MAGLTETYDFEGEFLPIWRFADVEELTDFVDGLGRETVRMLRGGTNFGIVDGVLFKDEPPIRSTAVAAFVLEKGWDDEDSR